MDLETEKYLLWDINGMVYLLMWRDIMDDGQFDPAGQGGQQERKRGNLFHAKQYKTNVFNGQYKILCCQ